MAIATIKNEPRAAVHLLNRAGFGPRPGQVKDVLAQGIEPYLKEQLNPAPEIALQKRLAIYPDLDYPIAKVLAVYRGTATVPGSTKGIVQVLEDFYSAKVIRAVESKNQLQEVLTDFWFNHFNVNLQNMFCRQSITSYERDAIRPHVLGKFKNLLGATASHPAMLFYLDNHLNKKDRTVAGKLVRGVNENYGRELLELHTLGVTAGYTQADVVAAARCFTGWTIDDLKMKGNFVYKPEDHDDDAKSVFGLELPAGGGRQDAEKLLDYVSVHPATARFISGKLARRFVSDEPPESLVASLAQTFLSTGGDIPKVMNALLTSEEFWAQAGTPKLKTPFEYVASALRATGAVVVSASPGLMWHLEKMGMQPYYCTPPTGYSDRGVDWLSPQYLHRLNFALDLAAGTVQGVRVPLAEVIRQQGGNPLDAASVAATLNREIFGGGLEASTLDVVRATPSGTITAMNKVAGLILASPEMQAR